MTQHCLQKRHLNSLNTDKMVVFILQLFDKDIPIMILKDPYDTYWKV